MAADEDALETRPVVAVGAVVVRDGCVLLVRRGKEPSRGLWAVPGGAVRCGESMARAAEREVLEETGIVVAAGAPVHAFDVIVAGADGTVDHQYVVVDLVARYVSGMPLPGDDAERAEWVSVDDLDSYPVHEETAALVRRIVAGDASFENQSGSGSPAISLSSDPSRSRR